MLLFQERFSDRPTTNPQSCLDPPKQNDMKAKDGLVRQENVLGKHNLMSGVGRRCSCSGMTHGCVNRIRLWPPRRDDSSGTLIGAEGIRRCD